MLCRLILVLYLIAGSVGQDSPPPVDPLLSPPPISPTFPAPAPLPSSPPPPLDPVSTTLLNFKYPLTNANQVLQNWIPGTDYCGWTGVSCDASRNVVNLSLPGQNPPLAGPLSSSLTSLTALTGIDLSNNQLSGPIPDAYRTTPLLSLQIWNMANNQFSGGPSGMGTGYQALKEFHLDGNQFKSFPQSWSFAGMNYLSIYNNLINGSVPTSWASVVPNGKVAVITPQSAGNRICDTLPSSGGVVWTNYTGSGTAPITVPLPPCVAPSPNLPRPPPTINASPPPVPAAPVLVYSPPASPIVFSPPPPPNTQSSGLGTPVIVAIAVGGGVGLIVLVSLLCWCCRPKKKGGSADAQGKEDVVDGMEAGYFTSNGEWKSARGANKYGPNGLMVAEQRRLTSGAVLDSALGPGSPRSAQHRQTSSMDQVLDWARARAAAEGAGADGAVSEVTSPRHGRSGSKGSASQLPLDVKLWTLNFRDMKIDKQIGEGSFGRVYLAKWNETLVAVKILIGMGDLEDESSREAKLTLSNPVLDGLAKESTMMATLRHPNVVGFLGVCMNPPCIVTEYCARGSMTDVLRGAKSSPAKAVLLDWPRRLNMALDAAKGMLYLHAHAPPIIHRDLKTPNLLVDRHWRVKVSDFNLSKLLEEGSVMSSMAATNPRWLAPEILTGNNATFASDVYSFAVVMWELLTWELPWGPTNPWQVVTVVTEGGRLEIPSRDALPGPDTATFEGLDQYIALMGRSWAHIPESRPTFQEIIAELRELLSAALARAGRVATPHPVVVTEETPSKGTGAASERSPSASPSEPPSVTALDRTRSTEVDAPGSPGSPYASMSAQTGSLLHMGDLDNSTWASRMGNSKGKGAGGR